MTRVSLRITQSPPEAEVMIRFLRADGGWLYITANVDTGAEITFLPIDLLAILAYDTVNTAHLTVERAGVKKANYEVVETSILVQIEDEFGNVSQPFTMPIWFGQTSVRLFGMTNALERGALHLDMQALSGYIDIP